VVVMEMVMMTVQCYVIINYMWCLIEFVQFITEIRIFSQQEILFTSCGPQEMSHDAVCQAICRVCYSWNSKCKNSPSVFNYTHNASLDILQA